MNAQWYVRVAVVLGAVIVPVVASPQTIVSGAIAGVVKDATGAVLPGVTVEASSPALIEKVRSVATDDQGNYKILDLRPGAYTVKFTLPGFSTVVREGLELTTAFTAALNTEMKVGSLEETVTVTGASPVVDVQNVRTQAVLSRQVLDSVPTGKSIQAYASLIVGANLGAASQDVGGNRGETVSSFGIHGVSGGDQKLLLDGMGFNMVNGNSGGGSRWYMVNHMSAQEIVLQTGANSAESETGGVQLNVVPKEGSNRFRLASTLAYSNPDLQQDNLTDTLRARGLLFAQPQKYNYDYGVGLGGPIKRDRLWFYTGHRRWGAAQTLGGVNGGFYNKIPESWFYEPDFSKPAYREQWQYDDNVRLTWQAAQKHKVNISFYNQVGCSCFSQIEGRAPEAAVYGKYHPNYFFQTTWSNPITNRLLLDAAVGDKGDTASQSREPGVTENTILVNELSTGLTYRAAPFYGPWRSHLITTRAAASYVTGSHAIKGGFIGLLGIWDGEMHTNQDVTYAFRNGIPTQLTQFATTYTSNVNMPNIGIYAQDQWTIKKLTANLGLRYDSFTGHVLAARQPGGRFIGPRDFPEVKDVPKWTDLSPRLGAAYDLFGNGKTAIKATLGRYLASVGRTFPDNSNPVNATVLSASRTWNDVNRDYIPQCDFSIPGATGECGALSNANFGRAAITTRTDEDLLHGFRKREYNWQTSSSIQHELRPGVAVNVGYFRTWNGNFTTTDNQLLSPGDFDPFCITGPADARLPGGGGQQFCSSDLRPSKFGQADNLLVLTNKFGKQTYHYDGFDLTLNAHFGRGAYLQGGMNTGKTVWDSCQLVVDSPDGLPMGPAGVTTGVQPQKQFCKVTLPFEGQTQYKFSGVYPLPYDLQVSATYQNLAGIPQGATYVATNAQVLPSLGRNLGACGAAATCTSTVTMTIMEPNTRYEDRLQQVDLRFTRIFHIGRGTVQGQFDVYNALNASTITAETTRFGTSAWLQPSQILGGRLFKFGAQIDF